MTSAVQHDDDSADSAPQPAKPRRWLTYNAALWTLVIVTLLGMNGLSLSNTQPPDSWMFIAGVWMVIVAWGGVTSWFVITGWRAARRAADARRQSGSTTPSVELDGDDTQSRHPHIRTLWMLFVLMLLGLYGAIAVCQLSTNLLVMCGVWLAAGALLIGLVLVVRLLDRRRTSADRQMSASRLGTDVSCPPRSEPPQPFRARLAGYLHVPESEVLVPRARPVSTMPFWSIVSLPQLATLAKPVAYIRAVLERIRAAVRG